MCHDELNSIVEAHKKSDANVAVGEIKLTPLKKNEEESKDSEK